MAGPSMEIGMIEDETYVEEYYINGTNDSYNGSMGYQELPYYLTFNEDSIREVVLYSLMFALAAAGNIPVFVTLIRNRHRKSRVNLMIMHLAIADLIVTFVMIPLEIAWRITVQWVAGNAACKIMLYMRAFGPYLSSSVLVCISLDRYFAILHPLKVNDAQRRGKIMLGLAWATSILSSIPQPFDMGRCPAGRFLFKQTPYKGATDPQFFSDSLQQGWALSRSLSTGGPPREFRLTAFTKT
ncbi:gonadotropin-releasing hormone II receptor [Trichonephila clavipes]|nr:gonadotropin-releasing hormone II receptor [Trichonephila clavipes]